MRDGNGIGIGEDGIVGRGDQQVGAIVVTTMGITDFQVEFSEEGIPSFADAQDGQSRFDDLGYGAGIAPLLQVAGIATDNDHFVGTEVGISDVAHEEQVGIVALFFQEVFEGLGRGEVLVVDKDHINIRRDIRRRPHQDTV